MAKKVDFLIFMCVLSCLKKILQARISLVKILTKILRAHFWQFDEWLNPQCVYKKWILGPFWGICAKKEMHVGHQIKRMNKKDITYRQQGFALLPKWRRLQKRLCSKLFEKIGPVMHFLLLKRERPLQKLVFSLPSQLQSFCLGSWVIYTQNYELGITNINFILKFFNEQFLLGLRKLATCGCKLLVTQMCTWH